MNNLRLPLVSDLMALKLTTMKTVLAVLSSWLISVAAWAQAGGVTLALTLEQDHFLPGEDIRVCARITNLSGQTLKLGDEEGWLKFYMEAQDGFIVEKYGDPIVAGKFPVENNTTATKCVNLRPHFNVQKPGRYRVMARINIPQWGADVSSANKSFDIIRGTKMQVLEFGVPQETATAAPQVRKYILQQAQHGKELKLYLRLTDETEANPIKVIPLARMMSFSKPEAQLDRFNNLHVLHQIGQRSFIYCSINYDGQILSRQTHDYQVDSRPRLRMAEDGSVFVKGGMRSFSETDLPPSTESSFNPNPGPPPPGTTPDGRGSKSP
jgi:hypothetical protein